MGNNAGFNTNYWNSMPTWNNFSPNFTMPSFNMNMPSFTNPFFWSGSSSSSSSNGDSYEEYQKELLKKQEEQYKLRAERNALRELEKAKSSYVEELRTQLNDSVIKPKDLIEKNKNNDGSSTQRVSHKEQGFWGKLGRWTSNAGTALFNMGKNIIGFDKDGKWNPKKCLTNVGITAAAIGACFIPIIGPVIGTGLAVTGLAAGAYGTYKGIEKLEEAEKTGNDKAIDEAQQDICTNAFVAITSAFGLRGIGKAFRTSATTASQASSATVRTSFVGKIGQSISNFGRDITVNAWRGTKAAMSADKALIAANGGGIRGFFKATGTKISNAWQSLNSWQKRYNDKYQQIEGNLRKEIGDINAQLRVETDLAKKALLQERKMLLKNNLDEIHSLGSTVKTKADYDKLLTENSGTFNREYLGTYQNSSGEYVVGGQQISAKQFSKFQKELIAIQKAYSKDLKSLVQTKENIMRTLAKNPDKNLGPLNEYIPASARNVQRKWYKPETWFKNDYKLAIGGKNSGCFKEIMGLTLTAPATTAPKLLATTDPIYSTPFMFGQDMSPEETKETLVALEKQKRLIENEIEVIRKIKTVDEFNAYITKAQAAAQEQSQEQTQTA